MTDLEHARLLAASTLIPRAYQGQPANVAYAMNLAEAFRLPLAAVLLGVHVLNGKPTLSAQLMAAMCRRAGHRLRTNADTGGGQSAELVRVDDPDHTFRALWTLERAGTAGLLDGPTWRAYPDQMLRARAVAEVIREGAPEVLAGAYLADEVGDAPDAPTAPVEPFDVDGWADGVRALVADESDLDNLRALYDDVRAHGDRVPPPLVLELLALVTDRAEVVADIARQASAAEPDPVPDPAAPVPPPDPVPPVWPETRQPGEGAPS